MVFAPRDTIFSEVYIDLMSEIIVVDTGMVVVDVDVPVLGLLPL